eukprot:533102_1
MSIMSLLLLLFLQLQHVLTEPIFFEVFGYRTECVFDWFDNKEVMQFFYEIRAEQDDGRRRSEIEIKIMTENDQLLTTRRGYQDRIHYEIDNGGIYKICFQIVGSYHDRTIIGIEMLGLKSESHYHQKNLVKQEHINPMYGKLIDIAGTLDELEAMQSQSKNWAIKYWDSLLWAEENLAFYGWIQGWLLLIVSICQIRLIRQWFAKVGGRIHTKGNFRV